MLQTKVSQNNPIRRVFLNLVTNFQGVIKFFHNGHNILLVSSMFVASMAISLTSKTNWSVPTLQHIPSTLYSPGHIFCIALSVYLVYILVEVKLPLTYASLLSIFFWSWHELVTSFCRLNMTCLRRSLDFLYNWYASFSVPTALTMSST